MTNAEKFEEVVGEKLNTTVCPLGECISCPNAIDFNWNCSQAWWNSEYKETN